MFGDRLVDRYVHDRRTSEIRLLEIFERERSPAFEQVVIIRP
jgi:hypothetical protein